MPNPDREQSPKKLPSVGSKIFSALRAHPPVFPEFLKNGSTDTLLIYTKHFDDEMISLVWIICYIEKLWNGVLLDADT